MSRMIGFSLLGLAIVASVMVWLWRTPTSAKSSSRSMSDAAAGSALASRALQAPARDVPGAPAAARPPASLGQVASATIRERMLTADNIAEELRRIEMDPTVPVADKLFYRALVLEACSGYQDSIQREGPEAAAAVKEGNLDRLIALVMGAMKDEKQKVAMQYNLKRKVWNACRGFAASATSQAEIEKAYAAAAAAGNPAAIARVVGARMAESGAQNVDKVPMSDRRFAAGAQGPVGYPDPITPQEHRRLLDAMFSEDPVAIVAAGNVLSMGTDRQSLRFGAEQVELGPRYEAIWTLAACEFGFECGQRNLSVNLACAERGRCSDDYASYLRDQVLTPTEFAEVQANAHAIAEAIRRHDLSAFQMVDEPARSRVLVGNPPTRIGIR